MKFLFGILDRFLPSAIVLTVTAVLVYATVQNTFRQSANDPQIQLAHDTAFALNNGASASTIVGASNVDISRSLASFLIVWDDTGQVVASSATLNGHTPELPTGVLDYTRQNRENRITWQPMPGVRIASVIVHTDTGFVLAGRSLYEIEEREANLTRIVGLAWGGGLMALLIAALGLQFIGSRLNPK